MHLLFVFDETKSKNWLLLQPPQACNPQLITQNLKLILYETIIFRISLGNRELLKVVHTYI